MNYIARRELKHPNEVKKNHYQKGYLAIIAYIGFFFSLYQIYVSSNSFSIPLIFCLVTVIFASCAYCTYFVLYADWFNNNIKLNLESYKEINDIAGTTFEVKQYCQIALESGRELKVYDLKEILYFLDLKMYLADTIQKATEINTIKSKLTS